MREILPFGDPLAPVILVIDKPTHAELANPETLGYGNKELIRQLSVSLQIPESYIYIIHFVNDRYVADDDVDKHLTKSRSSTITSEQFKRWAFRLEMLLATCPGKVIFACGDMPVYALTGKVSSNKWRGSILWSSCETLQNKKVVCSISLGSCLSVYENRWLLLHDFVKAWQEVGKDDLTVPKRTIHIASNYLSAVQFIEAARNSKYTGFDIECSVATKEMSCFAISTSPLEAMCIPLVRGGENNFSVLEEYKIITALQNYLEDSNVAKVMQNATFDAYFMLRQYGVRTRNIWDTMILMNFIYPGFPKNLAMISSLFTKEPFYKDDGKEGIKFSNGVEAGFRDSNGEINFYRYNATDALVTLEAFHVMREKLSMEGNWEPCVRQNKLIPPLLYMMHKGITVAVDEVAEGRVKLEAKIKESETAIRNKIGATINLQSPTQLKKYFYEDLGAPIQINRKTKKPSTDEEALKTLASLGYGVASDIISLRGDMVALALNYKMQLDPDNRMRTSMNPVGTVQGRLASRTSIFGTGGNMQNIPKSFRKYLRADDGYIFYSVDMGQAENRCVAFFAPDIGMMEAFTSGQDIHKLTASFIFRKPANEISSEEGSANIGSGKHSERDWGKKANHGLNYDLSPGAFAAIYEISFQDAKYIYDAYHSAYPGVHRWHQKIREKLRNGRVLENAFGRKRKFFGRWADEMFKEAYSFGPQSTVADLVNQRGVVFMHENQDIFERAEFMATVHDSMSFQIPLSAPVEYHARALWALKQSLETPIPGAITDFVIPADFSFGRSFYCGGKLMLGSTYEDCLTAIDRVIDMFDPETAPL